MHSKTWLYFSRRDVTNGTIRVVNTGIGVKVAASDPGTVCCCGECLH
jgi:hypothetical protein